MKYIVFCWSFFLMAFNAYSQTNIGGTINNYAAVTAINYTSCVSNNMTVDNASSFNVGDSVLIIQMQGATINTSNAATFGDISSLGSAGLFEKNIISAKAGNVLSFGLVPVNNYNLAGAVQIVSIPHYTGNVNVNSTLTAADWDGSKGGVLIFSASGNVSLSSNIDVSGKGFRGGANIALPSGSYTCNFLSNNNAYFYALNTQFGSGKGEGIAKFTANREAGRGKQANGGGGGNDHNSGGGGGGNGGTGGIGGQNNDPNGFSSCDGLSPGIGSLALDYSADRLYLGGGGGAGHANSANYFGGDGGGIVIIQASSIQSTGGEIRANGLSSSVIADDDGGSAGGGGGAVMLLMNSFANNLTVNAIGGNGANTTNQSQSGNRCFGPGGGGGGGAVLTNIASGPFLTAVLNGGNSGIITLSTNACNGTNGGASNGNAGVLYSNKSIPISSTPFGAGSGLAIVQQPVNDTICSSEQGIFTTEVQGSGLSYQWQQNPGAGWSNVSNGGFFQGVLTDSLTVVFTNNSYNGRQFRVLVSDDCGNQDTSEVVTLFVNYVVPFAVLSPVSTCEGESFSMGGIAPGIPANQINQWQINTGAGFVNIEDDTHYSGTNTSFLLVDSSTVLLHDSALFRAYYTAPGCDTSFTATSVVYIYSAGFVENDTVCIGDNAQFSVSTNLIDSFQWQVNNGGWFNLIESATYVGTQTANLTINNVDLTMVNKQYRVLFFRNGTLDPLCVQSNISPSNAAWLISSAPLTIANQSDSISLCSGESGFFYIEPTLAINSIQWQVDNGSGTFVNVVNGADYQGATNDTLQILIATIPENGDRFRAILTNDCSQSLTSPIMYLSVFAAPSVSISPTQTVCQGSNVFVSVTNATGSNITYQWQIDSSGVWQNLTNAGGYSNVTGSFLGFNGSIVVPSITTDRYRIIINTSCGRDTSIAMQLLVTPNIVVNTQPQNIVVCPGDTGVISILASNVNTYQWQSNASGSFTNLSNNATYSGVNTANLTINNISALQVGVLYRVVMQADFPCSSVTSSSASISLSSSALITNQSTNLTSCAGQSALLYVQHSGLANGYQWSLDSGGGFSTLVNGGSFSGATNDTLFINPILASMDGYVFQCTVTSACGADPVSLPISLSIGSALVINTQPSSVLVCAGENASFVIDVSGSSISYQWQQFNGAVWSNVNSGGFFQGTSADSLTVLNVQASYNGRMYRCIINDACGGVDTSNAATLNVNNITPLIMAGNFSLCEGSSGSIGVPGAPSTQNYQWQLNENLGGGWISLANNATFSGVSTSLLSISNAPINLDDDSLRVIVYNLGCDSSISSTILNIDSVAVINVQAQNAIICPSQDALFYVQTTGNPTYQWQFFDGTAYVNLSNGTTYQGVTTDSLTVLNPSAALNNTNYRVVVTSSNPVCGASFSSATLAILPLAISTISPVICFGDSFALPNGNFVFASGTYNDTLLNASASACDSIVQVVLTVLPLISSNLNVSICFGDSFALSDGSFVNSTGTYNDTLFNASANACDSVLIIDLAVLPLPNSNQNITLCFGDSLALSNGTFASSSGFYQDTLTSASACDSILNITLTILPQLTRNIAASICFEDSLVLSNGSSVNTTGIYNDTLFAASSNGCDSILIIDLSVLSQVLSVNNQSICGGESYILPGGQAVNVAGSYNDTLFAGSSNGCDSIIQTNLLVLAVPTNAIVDSFCAGSSYTLPSGLVVNVAGIYNDTLLNAATNTCDSINVVTLNFTAPLPTTLIFDTICFNDLYVLPGGQQVSAGGVYLDTLSSFQGCDSIIQTNLEVKPANSVTQQSSSLLLCPGSSALFYASSQQSNVSYQWLANMNPILGEQNDTLNFAAVFAAQSGTIYQLAIYGECDTIFSTAVQLNVRDLPSIIANPISDTVCVGQAFSFSVNTSLPVVSYQWFENGLALAGATTNVYAQLSASLTQNGNLYFCVITDSCGNVDSSATAVLSVNPLPVLLNQGANNSLCVGDNALFFVTATGLNLTYQWFVNGLPLAGQSNDTLQILGVLANQEGNVYRCQITSSCGSLNSNNFTLNVADVSVVSDQSSDILQCGGFSFEVFVEASNVASYQWQINTGAGFVNLSDGTLPGATAQIIGSTSAVLLVSNYDLSISGAQFQVLLGVSCGIAPLYTPITVTITSPISLGATIEDTTYCLLDLEPIFVPYVSSLAQWSNGDIGQYFLPEESGAYIVNFTDANACPASDTINITVEDCVAKCVVTAPTGFSPDGSGKNDIFRAIYGCPLSFYELSVYNRWGELVFFSDSPLYGWDGVFNGLNADIGVYAWYLRYQKEGSDKVEDLTGNVTLIR